MKNQIKQMAGSFMSTDPSFDAPNTAWEAAKLFEKASTDLAPDAPPEARQFVLDYMKDMTMHEVGHTLGLRHNFRASHGVRASQVADPEFTRREAFTNSVMEYAPVNLPRPGEPAAAPFQATLGTYDYWAIEYGYKPIPAEQEREELARIAARSGEPAGLNFQNRNGLIPPYQARQLIAMMDKFEGEA